MALQSPEFTFLPCETIRETKEMRQQHIYDLMILDINLPDGNGLDFLKELRKTSAMPVILLTANDLETDIVTGLESGADDYVTKPFSLAVLRAWVNARLRAKETQAKETFQIDDFCFNFFDMKFYKGDREI